MATLDLLVLASRGLTAAQRTKLRIQLFARRRALAAEIRAFDRAIKKLARKPKRKKARAKR